MSAKGKLIFKTDTLNLWKDHHGFWLWDDTRKMNLAMEAKTEREAFIRALEYYQQRLTKVETDYRELSKKVESFVESVKEEE